jgi:hypothetical protein
LDSAVDEGRIGQKPEADNNKVVDNNQKSITKSIPTRPMASLGDPVPPEAQDGNDGMEDLLKEENGEDDGKNKI